MFTHLKAFMFGGGGVKLVLWTVERDCFSNNYKKTGSCGKKWVAE